MLSLEDNLSKGVTEPIVQLVTFSINMAMDPATEARLEEIQNKFKHIGETLGGPLLSVLNRVLDVAEPMIDGLVRMAEGFAGLSPAVQDVIMGIAGVAAGAGPLLKLINDLRPVFTAVGTAISELGAGPLALIIGLILTLIGVGVALWKNWDMIKEQAQPLFEAFSTLFDTLKEASQNFFDSFESIWNDLVRLFETLEPLLLGLGLLIGLNLATQFGILISVISAVLELLGPLINAIINLVEVIANVVMAIISLLMGDLDSALKYWDKAVQASVDFFVNLFKGIIGFVSTLVSSLIDFFYGLYMTLVGGSIIPDMVQAILTWFSNMGKWLREKVMEMVNRVIGLFQNLRDQAVAKVESLKQSVREKMEAAKTAITTIWNKAKEFLSRIDLKQIGIDIIQGLLNGINSMAQRVWNKMTEIADGIKSKIKGALGIASPSKEMMKIGRFTGEGLAIGMDRAISDIAGTAKLMVQAVVPRRREVSAPGLSFAVPASLSGNPSEPHIVAPEYVVVKIGSRELVRAIAPEMGREQYRLKRERDRSFGRGIG